MDCEVLVDARMSVKAKRMLSAMMRAAPAAGIRIIVSERWQGAAPLLMSYGIGHMTRRDWTRKHVANGGRLIGWDLGYWDRDGADFKMRMTLDDDHPHRWIQPEPAHRFEKSGIVLHDDHDPDGHIVLCGIGRKQRAHLGLSEQQWERNALREIEKRFPGVMVVYKPKRDEQPIRGTEKVLGAIEDVLKGARLLVCHHSNVAVDACIAGVPVECKDGAAYALYRHGSHPSEEQRRHFLTSLAWWQYSPAEAGLAWKFIKRHVA